MQEESTLVSKVFVHETNTEAFEALKVFFRDNNLVGVRSSNTGVLEVLNANIDLGAILLSDEPDENGKSGIDLGIEIHRMRPELPIFLRLSANSTLDDLPEYTQSVFAASYTLDTLDTLKEQTDKYLFNTHYPSVIVRGIEEITLDSLNTAIRDMDIKCDTPFLVRDKLIIGELFSLIPIESEWCRGYMMLQTEDIEIQRMIQANLTGLSSEESDFRGVNSVLSEICNLVWGGIKSRFFNHNNSEEADSTVKVQVPIIINHAHRYISFGVDDPQLCFRYTIKDKHEKLGPITVYQRFFFHLSWRPEEFKEDEVAVDDMEESGELEFF